MRFSDGMKFDTSGPLRLTRRSDGWYVIGEGMLMPVDSPEEGREIIKEMQNMTKVFAQLQKIFLKKN